MKWNLFGMKLNYLELIKMNEKEFSRSAPTKEYPPPQTRLGAILVTLLVCYKIIIMIYWGIFHLSDHPCIHLFATAIVVYKIYYIF